MPLGDKYYENRTNLYLVDAETLEIFNPAICYVSGCSLGQSMGRARGLPSHKFMLVCINRTASSVKMSVHGETFGSLPALSGTHCAVEKRGDFFPRVEPICTNVLMGKHKLITFTASRRGNKGSRSCESAPGASKWQIRSHKI
jgi:hypothetical protein